MKKILYFTGFLLFIACFLGLVVFHSLWCLIVVETILLSIAIYAVWMLSKELANHIKA